MADTITESNVVQIILMDAGGNKQSFNIDNPRSGLTMSQIKTALATAISSGYWYSRNGEIFISVVSATITESRKIKLDNSEVTIIITPPQVTLANTQTPSANVSIEGANLVGAYITQIVTSASNANIYASTSGQIITVTGSFPNSDGAGTTATLNIVTDERTLQIEITVSN